MAFRLFPGICHYKYCYNKDTCTHILLYRAISVISIPKVESLSERFAHFFL